MKKYRCAVYLRISNSDNCENIESQSISNQRKIIDDFVSKTNDIEVISERLDDGFTGSNFERPAFTEMIKDVIDGKINCIIIKDLSRLGREYIETSDYLRNVFPKYGVRFISITEGIDTKIDSDLSSKLDVNLRVILNDSYSADISKKTRSALNSKRRNGEHTNNFTVYGYKKSDTNKNILIIDEFASKIVRDIFNMKKDGLGAIKIAEVLNEKSILSPLSYKKHKGIPHATGGYGNTSDSIWSATTIIRILKDITYTGTLIQGRYTTANYKLKNIVERPKSEWIITENAHKPIISKEDFELIQKLLQIDTRTSPCQDSVYMFSGMLICKCCGNRLTRKTVPYKDKKYYYCYCPTGKKNGCLNKMVKENDLLECVALTTKSYINAVIDFDDLLNEASIKKINLYDFDKYSAQIEDIELQINTAFSFKSTLYESLIKGLIEKSDYNSLKNDYDNQISKLQKSKDLIASEYENKRLDFSNKIQWTSYFKEFKNEKTLTRKMVIQLINSITIGVDEIHIEFRYNDEYKNITKALEIDKAVM